MPFRNLPYNLVAPPDTTSGARIEIGPDNMPTNLVTFYTTGLYVGASIISGIIYYGTDTARYTFDILLDLGAGYPSRVIGRCDELSGVQELFFMGTPELNINDLRWENTDGTSPGSVWTALTLQNSWVNFGGAPAQVTAQYMRVASPANDIRVVGRIALGTGLVNTVFAILPVGFRPLNAIQYFPVFDNAAGVSKYGYVDTNGNLKFGLAVGNDVGFNFSFSRDA